MSDIVENEQDTKEPEGMTDEMRAYIKDLTAGVMDQTIKAVTQKTDQTISKIALERDGFKKKVDELAKAQMDAEELKKYELDKQKQEIADKQMALEKQELEFQKLKVLGELGLSTKHLKIVAGQTIEEFKMNLTELTEERKIDLEALVTDRLKTSNPTPKGGIATSADLGDNPFSTDGENMTKAGKLWNTDRSTAKELINQANVAGKLCHVWKTKT
jgi:hypothetical protein